MIAKENTRYVGTMSNKLMEMLITYCDKEKKSKSKVVNKALYVFLKSQLNKPKVAYEKKSCDFVSEKKISDAETENDIAFIEKLKGERK